MTKPTPVPPIPADTNQAAKAVYSRDNLFLFIGDQLARILDGTDQNGNRVWGSGYRKEKPSLGLITVFQYKEMLSDPQAAEATRTRMDWKYALHLSMNYPGVAAEMLCAYRQWAMHEPEQLRNLQVILDRLARVGLLTGQPDETLEAEDVLVEVCGVTRFGGISQALQQAIGALATRQPAWLRSISLPHWYLRYQANNLPLHLPPRMDDRTAIIESVGMDIHHLFLRLADGAPIELRRLDEVEQLHEVWHEQFEQLPSRDLVLMRHCSFCGEALEGAVHVG